MIVGVSISVGVVSLILIFAVLYMRMRKDSEDEEGKITNNQTTCTYYSLSNPNIIDSGIGEV